MVNSESWNVSTTTATQPSAHTQEPSVYSLPLYKISRYIWYLSPPVILLFGNFGNVMTLVIMQRKNSGGAVINIYFTVLAAVDLVTLDLFLLNEWLAFTFGFSIKHHNDPVCKIYNWITTASTTIGGWYLVCMTIHRAISVVWPHRVNLLCRRRLVIRVIVGLTAFFAFVYSHYLYGYGLRYVNHTGEYRCMMETGSYLMFVDNVFTYVDLVLYSLMPFTCITTANSVLVWKLKATVEEVGQKFVERGSEQAAAREKAARSVTWTVVMVSGAYIVLTLPAAVVGLSLFVILNYNSAVITAQEQARVHVINASTYMLMFSNSAVNFYLYCLTGDRFRKEFVKVFCSPQQTSASVRTAESSELPTRLPPASVGSK